MKVIVVGGGLAGLSAAAWLAREGEQVTVLERTSAPGGRARTHHADGWSLNAGPHALYVAGAAADGLRDLGIEPKGGVVPAAGCLRSGGRIAPLPATPLALLTTPLLPGSNRWSALRWFAGLTRPDRRLEGRTVEEWLAPLPDAARALALYFVRLSTYAHAPSLQDAALTQRQLIRALQGVRYLDGGWAPIITALATTATGAGATIRSQAHVERAMADGVVLASGETLDADAVILAVPPATCRSVGATVPDTVPVRAACLDLGLARLPVPHHKALWDLDEPLYLSDHAAVAALAPPGGAAVHALRYLAPEEPTTGVIAGLERFVDEVQPGWRDEVRVRREAPALVVTYALDRAGVARPGIRSPEGLWLCGDWVEAGGAMLADASVASARAVAAALRAERRAAA